MDNVEWTVYHNNIRSMDSKSPMLKNIVNKLQPSVINLNELNYKGKRKLKIPGYLCFNKNRVDMKGGGVGTCVKEMDSGEVLKVGEGIH